MCFDFADRISLTTEGQAEFYRNRYPNHAAKIVVTSNMMPKKISEENSPNSSRKFRIVHTGALYGERDPKTFLDAVSVAIEADSQMHERLEVEFYGNMDEAYIAQIDNTPCCKTMGARSYEEIVKIQNEADVLLVIEPSASNELYRHFLLSKVVDYLAKKKPIVAVTPKASETWRLCESGYGRAFESGDSRALADFLSQEVAKKSRGVYSKISADPLKLPFRSDLVTNKIISNIEQLLSSEQRES